MKVGIVHGYGLYLPERKDYEAYLDFIAGEIEREKFDKVILCGGFTVPEYPDKSEASTAREYLSDKVDFNDYILEDRSINTNQNLEFAAEHLEKLETIDEVIVYGDYTRKPKIIWLALHFISKLPQKEIYKLLLEFAALKKIQTEFTHGNLTVRTYDFDKSKHETIWGQIGGITDVLALYDKELNEMDLEFRRKLFGLTD